jgi:thiamine monophosphate kinase
MAIVRYIEKALNHWKKIIDMILSVLKGEEDFVLFFTFASINESSVFDFWILIIYYGGTQTKTYQIKKEQTESQPLYWGAFFK